MTVPSGRERTRLLDELLTDGKKLFGKMLDSEEQLRNQLITGDYETLLEADDERNKIRQEVVLFEERRKALVPAGTSMLSYIKTMIGKRSQPAMLKKLSAIQGDLKSIRVLNEINQVLLAERLRFTRDLQESAAFNDTGFYDQKGRLSKGEARPSKKLDRNC